MTTSGSVNFTVNRDELIKDSLLDVGGIAAEDTPSASIVQAASRKLNMMLKAWQTFGLHLWKNREIVVFLDYGQNSYSIGSTGDHATLASDYGKTEMRIAGVASDTTLEVDSTTGMAASDYIGIELDTGYMHWTTVDTVTDSDTVVITDALPSAVAVDRNIYFYTTKALRPLQITDAFIRDDSDQDSEVTQYSRQEYNMLGDKSIVGSPSQLWVDPQTTNIVVKVYPAPDDVKERLHLRVQFPIEDMDSAADDFDCPQEWLLPIQTNLSVLLAPQYGVMSGTEFTALKMLADEHLEMALGFDVEKTSVRIQPTRRA